MAPLLLLLAILATQTPADRVATPLSLDIVAFDRSEMPVTDLKQEEVEVWIGGYRVPIETFRLVTPASDERGRSIVLILDDVTLPLPVVPRAREAARRFVSRMSPGDRMTIMTLNGTRTESTSDRARLLQIIDAYHAQATGVLRIDALDQQVLETIEALARPLSEVVDQRKTIVAIGAAWLFDTPIPAPALGRDLRKQWSAALRALAFANANFYVIDPGGVGMSRVGGGTSGFARETGGQAFVNTNDLNGAADRILREAGTYYLIAVADPPVGRKADLRELEVKSLRRGVTIRARQSVPGAR